MTLVTPDIFLFKDQEMQIRVLKCLNSKEGKLAKFPGPSFFQSTWVSVFISRTRAAKIGDFFKDWTEPVGFAFNFELCSEQRSTGLSVPVIPFFTPVTSKALNVNIV